MTTQASVAEILIGQQCFPQVLGSLTLFAPSLIHLVVFANHPKLGYDPLVANTHSLGTTGLEQSFKKIKMMSPVRLFCNSVVGLHEVDLLPQLSVDLLVHFQWQLAPLAEQDSQMLPVMLALWNASVTFMLRNAWMLSLS